MVPAPTCGHTPRPRAWRWRSASHPPITPKGWPRSWNGGRPASPDVDSIFEPYRVLPWHDRDGAEPSSEHGLTHHGGGPAARPAPLENRVPAGSDRAVVA